MTKKETIRDKMTECYECRFKEEIPGSTSIQCSNPDPKMSGHQYGIAHGLFCYPISFQSVWKEFGCANFSPAVYDGGENDPSSEKQKKKTRDNKHGDDVMVDAVNNHSFETNKVVIPDAVFDQIEEAMDEADRGNEHEAEQLELEVGKETK